MTTEITKTSSQSKGYQTFANLGGNFCKDEVVVRLIHFWEARNFKNGNILMGMELLFIDIESTTMHGFISANRLFRYTETLKANSIYKLQKFMVNPSKKVFQVTAHKFDILFTDQTSLVETNESFHKIDTQQFRLRTVLDLAPIVDRNGELFDIIGHIHLIKGDNLQDSTPNATPPMTAPGKSKDMVFLHVKMEDGEIVRVYLWDKIAANFRLRWNTNSQKPTVLLLTTINPKTVGGALTLSSTSSTRLFFYYDIAETRNFLTRLGKDGPPIVNSSCFSVTKLETVTLSEIQQFLQNETPQAASFICVATIVDVCGDYGWHYISCSGCKTKMQKTETSLFCTNINCKTPNTTGMIRYRFEVSVRDENNDATFVIFDNDDTKLVGKNAAEVLAEIAECGEHDINGGTYQPTPQCLLNIVGNTCKFQVKVTPYNFSAPRQTITVSRIIEHNIVAPANSGEKKIIELDGSLELTPQTNSSGTTTLAQSEETIDKKSRKRPREDN